MKPITFMFLAVATLFTVSTMADSSVPSGSRPSNTMISVMVAQWAKSIGRKMTWEAPYDYKFQVFENVQPSTVEAFSHALNDLNQLVAKYSRESPPPLMACIFDDRVVIRTITQPSCDKPLN